MIQEKVIAILNEVKPTRDLVGVQDIVEGGYLDSFELMNLIMMMCEAFDIEIDFEEITAENFNSIDAMVAMVERLQK